VGQRIEAEDGASKQRWILEDPLHSLLTSPGSDEVQIYFTPESACNRSRIPSTLRGRSQGNKRMQVSKGSRMRASPIPFP